jgi:hypothetical protein
LKNDEPKRAECGCNEPRAAIRQQNDRYQRDRQEAGRRAQQSMAVLDK